MPRILVVCYPPGRFGRSHYVLHAVALRLRQQGIEFIVQSGWNRRPEADLVVPHVDLTVWPPSLTAFLDHYPNVLNRRVTDISKRRVSRNLVGPADGWQGPVIVKTDANYGGIVERRYPVAESPSAGSAARAVASPAAAPPRLLPPHLGRYTVFARIAEVPPIVWRDDSLIVERFLPERAGELYVVRQLLVLGDRYAMREIRSTEPSVKGSSSVARRWLDGAPPPQVLDVARAHGLEFGKLDFTLVDNKPIVFDIARTPTGPEWIEESGDVIARLATGMLPLLRRGSDPARGAAPAAGSAERPATGL